MNFGMNSGWDYLTGRREYSRGAVTIFEYERGLFYRAGKFEKVLEAGRYRLWPWERARIVVMDVRRTNAAITNQKLLTSDQITVTLNVAAEYEFSDVTQALHRVTNYQSQLHEDVQLATRNIVGAVTVDALLENRVQINSQLIEAVAPVALEYGLKVLSVAIKDVILAPRVRDLLMKEVEAKRLASAMLIGAREEVAAMRALSNAARMAQENPALLRLRELEVARGFAQNAGNTVVMGIESSAVALRGHNNGSTPAGEVKEIGAGAEAEIE